MEVRGGADEIPAGWEGGRNKSVDVLGHAQRRARMPVRLIDHEHDVLVGTGSDLLSEGGQFRCERLDTDR
jgi:hypothetical protein